MAGSSAGQIPGDVRVVRGCSPFPRRGFVGVPRRATREGGGPPSRDGADRSVHGTVQRTTVGLVWEGNQKPMEGEGSDTSAATQTPGPVVSAEQGPEGEVHRVDTARVGSEARCQHREGRYPSDGDRCGDEGFFEGSTAHRGWRRTILLTTELLAARSRSPTLEVGDERGWETNRREPETVRTLSGRIAKHPNGRVP